MDEREVLRAAHVLHDYCKNKGMQCAGCPLRYDVDCQQIPEAWDDLPELEEPQEPEILQDPEVLRELKEFKLKEIKTIAHNIDYMPEFDRDVNEALAEGWTLVKREVIIPRATSANIALYAELVRYEDD